MRKFVGEKMKKRWLVAATSTALIGAGGFFPLSEPATVHAEESATEWSANTVGEVAQQMQAQNAQETIEYQIHWGDTLWALSQVTGVSVSELAAENNISNPDLIYAGDFLYGSGQADQVTEEVPVAEAQEPAAEETPDTEEETTETEVPETEPAEEAVESVEPAPEEEVEPEVEAEASTEDTPIAAVVVPEDARVPVEEVLPEETERVEIEEVVATEEKVEPNDQIVTDQPVAVVVDPASHKTPSERFIRPADGRLSSQYGYRLNPLGGGSRLHAGIDIAGSGPVVAVQDGTVVRAGYHSGWGNYVRIDHGNGIETLYAHLQNGSMTVSEGDAVSQGQQIGTMGDTGSATGVHLHFEVYVNGLQVDPLPYVQ